MFRFATPEWFQLLWALPVLVVVAVLLQRRARAAIKRALGDKLMPYLTASLSSKRRKVKFALEIGFIVCAVFALARPQFGESSQEISSQGVEMIILFDVSESMLAEDVRPSRIEFAKSEMSRMFSRLRGHKIGIVPFAGTAVLVSPLTSDISALNMYVDSLSPLTVSSQGTEFRRALEVAKEAFERGGEEQTETSRATRVILIVSDGEDNEAGAEKVANDLAEQGVRIFSLAFGTEKGAPIPMRDDRGYLKGYKKDRQGKKVLSATKGTVLKKLAEIGRGSFYHATFGGNAIKNIAADIDELEKTQFDSEIATNYDERFQVPLFFALLLALFELFFSERKRAGQFWRGRFEVKT